MPQPRPPHPTRHVTAALREDFVGGRLFPGQPLSILQLSQSFRFSPTPVREALARLVGEGLVVVAPGGGYACASLDAAELGRLRRLERMMLEPLEAGGLAAADLRGRLAARGAGREAQAPDVQWLWGEAARLGGDALLQDALLRVGGRLGVVRRAEGVARSELHALAEAFAGGDAPWRGALAQYFGRRRGREAATLDAVRRLEAQASDEP